MYDPDDDPFWDYEWVRAKVRPVVTKRFLELEAVEATEYGQVGAGCYTGPYGTNDHEGDSHG